MNVTINDWNVDLHVDDDGHLTVGINHADGSKVIKVDEDLSTNDTEYVDRFTTESIEKEYIDSWRVSGFTPTRCLPTRTR